MARSEEQSRRTTPTAEPATKPNLDQKVQDVLSLMVARSHGEVSNEQVEQAVSSLLSSTRKPSNAPPPPPPPPRKSNPQPHIEVDDDNYDDLEEPSLKAPQAETKKMPSCEEMTWTGPQATVESMREQVNLDDKEDPLEKIPLGRSGARMMVTFGDGKNPKPAAVSAALLGARQCLQAAVKDARALRRHAKFEYGRARVFVKQGKYKLRKDDLQYIDNKREAVDPFLLYRAMSGYDKLAYEPKCGFDIQQLQQLFPEEMNAYERWNQMHNAYLTSKGSQQAELSKGSQQAEQQSSPEGEDDKEDDSEIDAGEPSGEERDSVVGGHMGERLAQFDARTEQMKDDWYIKFAEARQGSFLPKRGKRSAEAQQWDASRKQHRKRGRPTQTWENLSAKSVQFLHWVGFDQRSALPPPNEETTQALAFLGYDFMGRIVEKAIFLRNLAKHEVSKAQDAETKDFLLELHDGEQLEVHDIEKSLKDTTIRPVPLYSATDDSNTSKKHNVAAQLYFGPGFENRLEMEMEELVAGAKTKNRLSGEELEIRKREDELFERLKEAPVLEGALNPSILGEENRAGDIVEDGDNENGSDGDNEQKKPRQG